MHFCQVMVIGFCGCMEVLFLIWNSNDGGSIEEQIYASSLTITTFYSMLLFSAVKGAIGIHVYKSFASEYQRMYGIQENDIFWNEDNENNGADYA